MASVILVVGFLGMIQAVTIGSEMLATARRQTIAAQILNHEMENLRLQDWATINALAATTTWNSGSNYAVNATVRYQGGWFICLRAHTNHAPTEGAYWAAAPSAWVASRAYSLTDVVFHTASGGWYRYINTSSTSGNAPTNTTYWEPYLGPLTNSTASGGVSFSVSRMATNLTTDMREVTFVVSWTKSGTTAAASVATGSWLQRLSFSRSSPIARTYNRASTTWFTKYGLNHAIQRS